MSPPRSIDSHFTAAGYDHQVLILRLKAEAEWVPCPLCGEVHRMRIHALLLRKIRTQEERNTEILIVSIYCFRARKRGQQYTKRILPAFVIPECNITLESVLLYVSQHPDSESIDYQEASYLLGSYDYRTIRRHIEGAWQMIRIVNLWLSSRLAGLLGYSRDADVAPGDSDWAQLQLLLTEASESAVRMGEAQVDVVEAISPVHAVYVAARSRTGQSGIESALDLVFAGRPLCDTS